VQKIAEFNNSTARAIKELSRIDVFASDGKAAENNIERICEAIES
jgi:hypothetical protein